MKRDKRLAGIRCPSCDHLVDAATFIDGEKAPKADDLSVCVYCFAIGRFRASGEFLKLEPLLDEQFAELPSKLRAKLKRTQRVVREFAESRKATS